MGFKYILAVEEMHSAQENRNIDDITVFPDLNKNVD